MRTVAAKRQAHRADLTSTPQALTWLVYCRENKLLTASEWALAGLVVTLGQGQNITMSVTHIADILHMKRDTVADAIKGLIAKGLMVFVKPGRNRTKVYRLTLPGCLNGDQPVARMGTNQLPDRGPTVAQTGTTTSREHEELDEHLTSTCAPRIDGDVAAPSGRSRAKGSTRSKKDCPAKDGFPALEEYVADVRVCRDELARRLGVDPGSINVKVLAKQLRDLCVEHAIDGVWSDLLDAFQEDDPIWAMSASGNNPVGFLMFALKQRFEGNEATAYYRRPAGARAEVEVDPWSPVQKEDDDPAEDYRWAWEVEPDLLPA
jgi:hypothetical protein